MLLQAPGGNGKGGDRWEEGLHALDPGAWMKSTVMLLPAGPWTQTVLFASYFSLPVLSGPVSCHLPLGS